MHLPTLIFVTLLINLMIACYLLVLYKRRPKDKCFKLWALSCFCFVGGGILSALRAYQAPPILSFFLADLLLTIAPFLVFVGLTQFSRLKLTHSLRKRLGLAALVYCIALLLVHNKPLYANVLAALACAGLFLSCAYILRLSVFREPVFTSVLSKIFTLHAIIMLLQGVLFVLHKDILNEIDLPETTVFTLLSHVILTTMTALLLPWLSFLKLERKLTFKSQRDSLTTLANRAHFYAQAEQYWSNYQEQSAALLVLDIDHFKSINDRYGHPFGDEVLKRCSKVLSKALRANDVIGRIGGEEFAVLLINANPQSANNIAERLRIMVQEQLEVIDEKPIHLSISIGMVIAKPESINIADAMKLADEALYKSKKAGRNRVTEENI